MEDRNNKKSESCAVLCPLKMTEKAIVRVKSIILEADYDTPVYLRVKVQGGGCSGFQNKLDLDPNYNDKLDHLFNFDGIGVIVDRRSMLYLEDAEVDFHDEFNKNGFSVNNPAAKTTCGCGSSYSV